MSKDRDGTYLGIQCGFYIIILIVNMLAGGWSVNYLLNFFASKVIPFGWAMVIGLFAGEISIPVAVVVAILHMFHVI
jgi:hypothetical protein